MYVQVKFEVIITSLQTPALINTGKPVGVTSGMDQSESINLAASTATKESGFSDSFICSECSLLRKVQPVTLYFIVTCN